MQRISCSFKEGDSRLIVVGVVVEEAVASSKSTIFIEETRPGLGDRVVRYFRQCRYGAGSHGARSCQVEETDRSHNADGRDALLARFYDAGITEDLDYAAR